MASGPGVPFSVGPRGIAEASAFGRGFIAHVAVFVDATHDGVFVHDADVAFDEDGPVITRADAATHLATLLRRRTLNARRGAAPCRRRGDQASPGRLAEDAGAVRFKCDWNGRLPKASRGLRLRVHTLEQLGRLAAAAIDL